MGEENLKPTEAEQEEAWAILPREWRDDCARHGLLFGEGGKLSDFALQVAAALRAAHE